MLKSLIFAMLIVFALPLKTQAQDWPTAQVVARRDETGVTVRYQLPAPVDRVTFGVQSTIRDRWTVMTPGLTLADGAVTGTAPFDAFELHILPDAAEVDRVYVGLSLAGEGRVLFGPGLRIQGTRTVLAVELAEGEASLPADNLIDGNVYIGPTGDVAVDARAAVVSGGNVPPELQNELREALFGAMAFYQARLGAAPGAPLVLIGSIDSPGPSGYRGDFTDNGMISVRFQGEVWREVTDHVWPFVWHEAFHVWNSDGSDLDAAPWLHEGGAEYATTVGLASVGEISEAQSRERLTEKLNGCRDTLADLDLDPVTLQRGSGPYDCGVLIQWLADLEKRRAGSGDIFGIWKAMLDGASGRGGYSVADFRALLVSDSAVAVLLDGPGATRWATIKSRLETLGVTLANRPGDSDLQAAALFHVAARNCPSGSYGYFNNPGALKLDGQDCGVLSGEPVIDTVEGFNPQTEARAMFAAVQARCAEGLSVRYAARDGRVLEAVCDQPLTEPEIWAIVDAPPLAVAPPRPL